MSIIILSGTEVRRYLSYPEREANLSIVSGE